jgi:hypothetical protein
MALAAYTLYGRLKHPVFYAPFVVALLQASFSRGLNNSSPRPHF